VKGARLLSRYVGGDKRFYSKLFGITPGKRRGVPVISIARNERRDFNFSWHTICYDRVPGRLMSQINEMRTKRRAKRMLRMRDSQAATVQVISIIHSNVIPSVHVNMYTHDINYQLTNPANCSTLIPV